MGTTDPGVDCLNQSAYSAPCSYFAILHILHILHILNNSQHMHQGKIEYPTKQGSIHSIVNKFVSESVSDMRRL